MPEFVHLHLHSQYSFLTGAVKLKRLPARVKAQGMRAVALTDHGNMFGALRHYNACSAGVQPMGSSSTSCAVAAASRTSSCSPPTLSGIRTWWGWFRAVIFARERARAEHHARDAQRAPKGLVALSGCLGGYVPQNVLELGPDRAKIALGELSDIFEPGHLFVELQDHGLPRSKPS